MISTYECGQWHSLERKAIGVVTQESGQRYLANFLQLQRVECARIDTIVVLIVVAIALLEACKLIGYDLSKGHSHYTTLDCLLQKATHPEVNVIGCTVNARQLLGNLLHKN